MDLESVLKQLDEYQRAGQNDEAEKWLISNVEIAISEGDNSSLLSLLNELMGHYRELSRVDESFTIAKESIALAERMGLTEQIPYATTLLNAANAYRAGGALRESENCYIKVRDLYDKLLPADSLLRASLENNLALLYQEQGEYKLAKEALKKALLVVLAGENTEFEVGVTYANLASTSLALDEDEEALNFAEEAQKWFKKINVHDSHYAAAIAAKGIYYMKKGEFVIAKSLFNDSMIILENMLGRNEYYERLKEYAEECDKIIAHTKMVDGDKGIDICREYYEEYGKAMIDNLFPEYKEKIAVGLIGEGSDCSGYDDAISRDHDWGPRFGLFVTKATYEEIGTRLQAAYDELPKEFRGYKRNETKSAKGRSGVILIDDYFFRLSGASKYSEVDWRLVNDASLAALVSGQIFEDSEGILSSRIDEFRAGYPLWVKYLKIAEEAVGFSQNAQYNYKRANQRGDELTAKIHLFEGIKSALRLFILANDAYPTTDKWLKRQVESLPEGAGLIETLERAKAGSEEAIEESAERLALILYRNSYISDTDSYLANAADELRMKSELSKKSIDELAMMTAEYEFKAFDEVKNEGGRASCQDDWTTFSIMRRSQYLTWNKEMLMQFLYDFDREYSYGHNLITEKYGRMMESTAPLRYAEIKDAFPTIPDGKKQIIEAIVSTQVAWMEDFKNRFPGLARNARSIHTSDDTPFNTSYETYLRGELGTYSDKMLELYGRFIAKTMQSGENLAEKTMLNSARLYGYSSLAEAEANVSDRSPACTIKY